MLHRAADTCSCDKMAGPARVDTEFSTIFPQFVWTPPHRLGARIAKEFLGLDAEGPWLRSRVRPSARATPGLAEMARWQSAHALMPFILIGRIAGVSDEQSLEAWKRGEREQIIARAIKAAPRP